jgi:hypothetical protein
MSILGTLGMTGENIRYHPIIILADLDRVPAQALPQRICASRVISPVTVIASTRPLARVPNVKQSKHTWINSMDFRKEWGKGCAKFIRNLSRGGQGPGSVCALTF